MRGGQSEKTKVVVRRLPPAISRVTFIEQIDVVFAGCYNWFSFRPGTSSQKHQSCSRAYINFTKPEDVIGFAEFFRGHLFVNEKGTQFRAIVEYAPSQRVPKQCSKKDGREGIIWKDPAYLDFLELISKPAENLPSAEMQLERREAERAGSAKDTPIITPLMEFVRQKGAAKDGSRRILSNGKISRRADASGSPCSASSKRSSGKKRVSTTMYVLRDTAKSTSGKDKSTCLLVPERDDLQLSDKAATLSSAPGNEVLEHESGVSGIANAGKKKILLLKGKEREISINVMPVDRSATSSAVKQMQRHEASGRIIRSLLLNKDSRQNQSSGVQSEQQIYSSSLEKEKHPLRHPHVQLDLKVANGASDDKSVGTELLGFSGEKQEKCTRNKDRPDHVVWIPLHQSDGSYASDESVSSFASVSTPSRVDSLQGDLGDTNINPSNSRSTDVKTLGSGRSTHSFLDNGAHKHFSRRGPSHATRDADGSSVEGKPSKRGSASGYGSHEKQVWVQKSSSGS